MKLSSPSKLTESTVTLSIVVPLYNEEEVIEIFHNELTQTLMTLPAENIEVIYVNDGSSDNSWQLIQKLPSPFGVVRNVNLSRNFGKEAAVTAGLDLALGQAVIMLDADLQDPPSLIPNMLTAWRRGFHVVNMQRKERLGESWLKKFCAATYYQLLDKLADVPVSKNVGDFRLLSREVVDAIKSLPERNRYMKGIMSWPGYKQTTLTFERPARAAGDTKWSFMQLVALGLSGITAFSVKPLKLASWTGMAMSLGAFLFGLWVFIKTLIFGEAVAGFPTLILIQILLGGVQLIAVGILGEYIGRIYTETKNRPVYLIMEQTESEQVQQQHHVA